MYHFDTACGGRPEWTEQWTSDVIPAAAAPLKAFPLKRACRAVA